MFKKRQKKHVRKISSRSARKTNKSYYKRSYKKRSKIFKIIRSIVAIVSISALILFIVVVISKISEADRTTIKPIMSKLFTRFNTEKLLNSSIPSKGSMLGEDAMSQSVNTELLFKICLISDIHEDIENLSKSLEKIQLSGCRSIFVLGDLTNYGTTESLKKVREVLKGCGIEYRAIPGDHDIAETLDVENFNTVFGVNYHIMEYGGIRFLMVDNSANFTEISKNQISWIESNIDSVDFVILSQPLFVEGLTPPFNSTYMGNMLNPPEGRDMEDKQGSVKKQRDLLLDMIRKNGNIKAVISGDHHRSSKLVDPFRSDLSHHVVGAVTSTFNDYPQSAIQTSRFSVLSIFKDGSYSLEDILID